ncbi:MAG: hypothetical protein LRY51_06810 [Geovibrio sp.]|nr:hypothetical protein [Geovibrio sp.]
METVKYTYDVNSIVDAEVEYRISEGEEVERDSLYEDFYLFELAIDDLEDSIAYELNQRFPGWRYGMFVSLASNTDWRGRSGFKLVDLRDSSVRELLEKASGGLIHHADLHWSVEFHEEGYFDLHVPHHDADTWCEVWFLPKWIECESYSKLLFYRRELKKEGYEVGSKRDKASLAEMLTKAIEDDFAYVGYDEYGYASYHVR